MNQTATLWPAMSVAQAHALLTQPGSPFEMDEAVIRGVKTRVWKNAPPTMRDLFALGRAHGGKTFIVYEDDRATFETFTRAALAVAAELAKQGVKKGDRVALIMRNLPEWPAIFFGATIIGAIVTPLNAWWTGPELEYGLVDSGAKVAFVDAERLERIAEHLVNCPDLKTIYVSRYQDELPHPIVRRLEDTLGKVNDWDKLPAGEMPTTPLESDDDATILYTSGTTGKPKGTLHVHGGFPVKTAQDMAHGFDAGADDTIFWYTDIGWMMGPWLIFGSLILGATMVLYEGTPDFPAADRLWRMVAEHRVTVLGVSPTLVRGLMTHGDEVPAHHDLSSLRILGGTGEPWNPEPFHWFFKNIGGGRIPVINYTGGTEISGGILCGNVITHLRPCAFAGPVPGIAADVVDAEGQSVRGEVGELVIRNPWPGMTRGFWGDQQRYIETYWSRFEGIWVHGDWAYVDPEDGLWYVLGRSDDTIKIAGKRLGPAEVESVLVGHPWVAESAAIGVPDELKGEVLVCFVILRPKREASDKLAVELADLVATALGKPLRPKAVHFVSDLPRTRNAKILRRVVKSVYIGKDPGDLSSLENPSALAAIGATRT
jgi:acetyl-CoA synthetase